MKEKASRKLANGQNIDYSEKENGPKASSAPALGLNTIIFKHVFWYMQQISGERLQDHWSSGSYEPLGSVNIFGVFLICSMTFCFFFEVFITLNPIQVNMKRGIITKQRGGMKAVQ